MTGRFVVQTSTICALWIPPHFFHLLFSSVYFTLGIPDKLQNRFNLSRLTSQCIQLQYVRICIGPWTLGWQKLSMIR
ncbi:hypothetical protein C8Q75DRAFT_124317 [Abortiporus biennis]|nr:hypothetical protein C8Q75DRAFT_124317 [Abortiporus biennis]